VKLTRGESAGIIVATQKKGGNRTPLSPDHRGFFMDVHGKDGHLPSAKRMAYLSDQLGSSAGRMLFSDTMMPAPDPASHGKAIGGTGGCNADLSLRAHGCYRLS
jgi:hypothetical protein